MIKRDWIRITLVAMLALTAGCSAWAEESRMLFEEDFSATPAGAFPERLTLAGGMPSDHEAPLVKAFRDFHAEINIQFLYELERRVRQRVRKELGEDHPFLISGNLAGVFHEDRWFEFVRAFDFLNNEYMFDEDNPDDAELLNLYLMCNALERPVVALPGHINNSKWRSGDNPEFYAMMTAQAYAMGHILMVPYSMYDGSFKGRWFGRVDTHGPVFHFVDRIGELLDGYEGLAWHGVILPTVRHNRIADRAIKKLSSAYMNDAVGVRFFFSGPREGPLDEQRLRLCDSVSLLGDVTDCAAKDREVIKRILRDKPTEPTGMLQVRGSGRVWVTARASVNDPTAPMVLHVLNRAATFDEVTTLRPLEQVTIRIHRRLLQHRPITQVRLYDMAQGERMLPVKEVGDYWTVTLPQLRVWAVLAVDAGDFTRDPSLQVGAFSRKRPLPASDIVLMRPAHRYEKPDHIRKVLLDENDEINETRVIDAYKVTRISWEYQMFPGFRERGVKYHGAANLGMAVMSDDRSASWLGWARTIDQKPMVGRADFVPPQYVSCAAAEEALARVADERLSVWIDEKVDGMVWDDVSFAVHRAWPQGGDFSLPFIKRFAEWLPQEYSPAELRAWGAAGLSGPALIARIEEARRENSVFTVTRHPRAGGAKVLRLPLLDAARPEPIYWLGTPTLISPSKQVVVEVQYYLDERGETPTLGLYLKDPAGGSTCVSAFAGLTHVSVYTQGKSHTVAPHTVGAWHCLRMRVDFSEQTTAFSLDGAPYSAAYPFRAKGGADEMGFTVQFIRRPNNNETLIRKIVVTHDEN